MFVGLFGQSKCKSYCGFVGLNTLQRPSLVVASCCVCKAQNVNISMGTTIEPPSKIQAVYGCSSDLQPVILSEAPMVRVCVVYHHDF